MSLIRSFDQTGHDYHLFLDNKSKHKTIFGGLFTIFVYIFISIYVVQSLSDFINLKKYTSTYNYYYVSNLNETSPENNFQNEYFFKFKLGMISIFPSKYKVENYYRFVIRLNDITSYIIPNCENNSTFCFNRSAPGFEESFLNYVDKIELLPCSNIQNIMNPEETKKFHCNPNYEEFESANRQNIVTINFNTELISFPSNLDKFYKAKNKFSVNLSYGNKFKMIGKFEILTINFRRNDFIFGFDNEFKYLNFFKSSEEIENSKENKFQFSLDFLRNIFSKEYIGVHQYKISYNSFTDFLSSFGGLIKISNILFWCFKYFLNQNLCYEKMYEIIDYSNINFKNDSNINNINNKSESDLDSRNLNMNNNLNQTLKGKSNTDLNLGEKFYKIDSQSYSNKSCYSKESLLMRKNINKCRYLCLNNQIKKLIKKLFSFENLFAKFRELNILKRLLLQKDQIAFLEYMARNDYKKSNKTLIKENFRNVSCSSKYKTKLQDMYDYLTDYDKIMIKYST
jgi:hypothetical protein